MGGAVGLDQAGSPNHISLYLVYILALTFGVLIVVVAGIVYGATATLKGFVITTGSILVGAGLTALTADRARAGQRRRQEQPKRSAAAQLLARFSANLATQALDVNLRMDLDVPPHETERALAHAAAVLGKTLKCVERDAKQLCDWEISSASLGVGLPDRLNSLRIDRQEVATAATKARKDWDPNIFSQFDKYVLPGMYVVIRDVVLPQLSCFQDVGVEEASTRLASRITQLQIDVQRLNWEIQRAGANLPSSAEGEPFTALKGALGALDLSYGELQLKLRGEPLGGIPADVLDAVDLLRMFLAVSAGDVAAVLADLRELVGIIRTQLA